MKKSLLKLMSAGMILAMGLGVAGCGSSSETTVKSEGSTAAESKDDSDKPAEGDNAAAFTVESGKLIMATNAYFPPYEYHEGDQILGIDAEIADAIAKKLGLELEIMDVEFASIITGVQSNKYDMGMAGMTVTDERKTAVNFSDTYAKGVQSVIVKEDSPIKDIDTLLGGDYKVGVQEGTTGDLYMADTPENGGVGEDRVVRFSKGNDAVVALSSGKVDAVVIDNEPAKSFVAANEGLKVLETPFVEEEYAICMNKENTELLNKVNAALKELTDDGTIPGIIEKYIPSKG